VVLILKSGEPHTEGGFDYSLQIIGFFSLPEPMRGQSVPSERVVNALTILYGIARGHLHTVSTWFGRRDLIPTVYFTDLVNEKVLAARRELAGDEEEAVAKAG